MWLPSLTCRQTAQLGKNSCNIGWKKLAMVKYVEGGEKKSKKKIRMKQSEDLLADRSAHGVGLLPPWRDIESGTIFQYKCSTC